MINPKTLQYITPFELFKTFCECMKEHNGGKVDHNFYPIVQKEVKELYKYFLNTVRLDGLYEQRAFELTDVYTVYSMLSRNESIPEYLRNKSMELAENYRDSKVIVIPDFK